MRRLLNLLGHRRLPFALALLACLPLLPALGAGFQLDDHFHRFRLLGHGEPAIQLFVFQDGDPARNTASIDAGSLPWWTPVGFRHASLRYLSVLTMQLDYALWPDAPALMHLHSLVWLAALVASAALFFREILGAGWVAGLAALLYALDDAHALPATYLANRNALIASCFGTLSVLCHARARRSDWRPGAVLSPVLFALALAAGELAVATAAYLLAFALFLEREPGGARWRALAPNAAVLLGWAVAYKLGGFGAAGSGFYLEPLADPLAFARAALERIPLLLMGQWTPVPSDFGTVYAPGTSGALTLRWIGVGTVVGLVALFSPLVRGQRVARFFAFGSLLSLLPISAVGPQNRLLAFVSLGAMGLLAQLVHVSFSGAGASLASSVWRVPAKIAAVGLLAIHLLLSPLLTLANIDFQDRAATKMTAALASVPADAAIAEQDLVIVNAPEHVYLVTAIPVAKRNAGQPTARHMRALAAVPSALELTRVDPDTLRVRIEDGLFSTPFSRYYRSPELPFAVGDRIELTGFSVEVLRLNSAGDPDELAYRFARPLDDPSLRWLAWQDGVYVPWHPPHVGESVSLPAPRGIFE